MVAILCHAGVYAFDEPTAGHGSDPVECHCNSFHTGTSKLEAHGKQYTSSNDENNN